MEKEKVSASAPAVFRHHAPKSKNKHAASLLCTPLTLGVHVSVSPSAASAMSTRVAVLLTASPGGHDVTSNEADVPRLDPMMSTMKRVMSVPHRVGRPCNLLTGTPLLERKAGKEDVGGVIVSPKHTQTLLLFFSFFYVRIKTYLLTSQYSFSRTSNGDRTLGMDLTSITGRRCTRSSIGGT